MTSWFVPIVSLLVGAWLNYWVTVLSQRRRHLVQLRQQAYSDYLQAVAAASNPVEITGHDVRLALRDAATAKAKIAVYGNSTVLNALAIFEESGACLMESRGQQLFVELVREMRGQSGAEPDVIKTVLLGSE